MDTCSTVESAVKTALKGLILAQQGCQGPFFLGFWGPNDPESLRAVSKVTSVFSYPQVTSSSVKSSSNMNVINVQTLNSEASARVSNVGLTASADSLTRLWLREQWDMLVPASRKAVLKIQAMDNAALFRTITGLWGSVGKNFVYHACGDEFESWLK